MPRPRPGSERPARLPDLCAECFMLILQLHVTREVQNAEVFRKRVTELLDRLERDARAARIEQDEIQNAKFALVAFIDEAINNSTWPQKDAWLANPLQLELFRRYDAGEEFFVRLEQLRQRAQANAQVLEVYYLCLALGFKGKYQFQETDRLRVLIQDIEGDMRRAAGQRAADTLSPAGLPRDTIAEVVTKEIPLWVIGVVAGAIAFFFFVIMRILSSNATGDVVELLERLR